MPVAECQAIAWVQLTAGRYWRQFRQFVISLVARAKSRTRRGSFRDIGVVAVAIPHRTHIHTPAASYEAVVVGYG